MGRIFCNYHPRAFARWHCPRCAVDLCPDCVQTTSSPYRDTPDCPLCDKPTESLGLGNVIVPFWQRLPKIFAYPLQPTALIYLLGLSLLGLFQTLPLLGFLVALLLYLATLQYSLRLMERTASGHMQPPEPSMRGEEDVTPRVAALFLVYIAVELITQMAGHHLGLPGYLTTSAFFSLMLPASIIIVGLEQGFFRSLLKAVNPVSLTALATRIGLPYLLLFVFFQLLSGAGDHLQRLLLNFVPAWAAAGTATFAWMYMHLVTYHLLGYVIYQYHEELGYEVDVQKDQSGGEVRTPVTSPAESALSQADVLLKEGEVERAENLLRERIDADPTDLEVWKRYYRVLQARGDDERLVAESKDYISALLLANRAGPAVEVAAQALERDPDFRPAKPEQILTLARTAREGGRPKLALRLMHGFARENPDHPDLPALSVLSARVLSEDLRQDARARPILEGLLQRFPDDPATDEAQRLLRAIGTA